MKATLRREFLQKREQITHKDLESGSRLIQERILSLPEYEISSTILFYSAFRREVRTERAIGAALREKKRVVLPATDRTAKKLSPRQILHYPEDLVEGPYSILEPKPDRPLLSLEEIDLVIVPGVAFDVKGARLGYGGGYYDRLLQNRKAGALLLGIAFELQIAQELPWEEHDIKMDKIATEKRLINCHPDFSLAEQKKKGLH